MSESLIRLSAFLGIFATVALCELLAPRRQLTTAKINRWISNIVITVIGTAIVRGIFPVLAASFAKAQLSAGVLNQLAMPYPIKVFIAVLALDLIIYLQHIMFHVVPLFWRLHMMHHADLDIDVTTGLRFHPIEILLSMGIKLSAIIIVGPPVLAVIIFEVLLNGTSMFNHGNINLPPAVDRWLRLLVVTPDMHRVHHSVIIRETNSNFGFNFPWWDRFFGTYRSQPVSGHEHMTIGLSHFRKPEALTLPKLLILPFTHNGGRYSLNYIGQDPKSIKAKEQD